MSESICNGCNKHCSEHGLDRHLRSMQNQRCHNIYLSHQGFLPRFGIESDQGAWKDVDTDVMPDTIPRFGGNHFGTNYAPEDFQMSTESNDEVFTGDADECDEAEETAELEHGWEPPPIDLSSQNTNISDDHNSDNWESTDSTPTLPMYRLPVLSHRHIYRVKYSDRFPASQVGMPLGLMKPKDDEYATSLGGGDNPWRPFHNELEWQVARWAKLQGPGSTAFDELLSINGVRIIC